MKLVVNSYVLGIGFILIPFFNFLSVTNLSQLITVQLIYSSLSLIPFVLVAFILSWGVSKIVRRGIEFKANALFPLICTGFYLQFFYSPLAVVFLEFFKFSTTGYEDEICKSLALLLLVSSWLAVIILGLKYSKFMNRVLTVFVGLVLVVTIVPSLQYLITKSAERNVTAEVSIAAIDTAELDSYTTSSQNTVKSSVANKPYTNIYFVIMDAMISLENASNLDIVERERELIRLKKLGLTYVEKTLSSYTATRLTLASIMQLDYFITPTSGSYFTDNDIFFRQLMYAERNNVRPESSLPIFYALKKANALFIWQGSWTLHCYRSKSFRCSYEFSKNFDPIAFKVRDYLNWTLPFYAPSTVGQALLRILRSGIFEEQIGAGGVGRTLIPFMNFLDGIINLDQPTFTFVHHIAPHPQVRNDPPYEVTETCDRVKQRFAQELLGYGASYRCALKEIEQFLKKVNAIDPGAIVILQGDHGWDDFAPIELSKTEKISYRANIFNAIKAPESCFNRYGIPQSTVNSIRFALNCAYGFNFPFETNIHYRESQAGEPKSNKYYTAWRYMESVNE